MSTNYYLRNHIYKGRDEAHLDTKDRFDRKWLGAFDEVPVEHPLRRAIDDDNPLIHVCLTGSDRIYWAMIPEHVRALAGWYLTQKIFTDEYGDELTGKEFLEKIDSYDSPECKAPIYNIGKWFS
jgi:hypothetical protein